MIETVQTKDGIDEPEFGYYARMEGYTNLSSDMKELAEMAPFVSVNEVTKSPSGR